MRKRNRIKKRAHIKNAGSGQNILFDDDEIMRRTSEIAGPLCASEGVELVCVEGANGVGGRVIRVYIDKPGGVTIDDCARINRQLNDILDVSMDGVMERRGLEVSSPGQNRPLSKESDFERFKGESARVKFRVRDEEKFKNIRHKTVKGTVIGMSGENIEINVNKKPVTIRLDDIIRARLV